MGEIVNDYHRLFFFAGCLSLALCLFIKEHEEQKFQNWLKKTNDKLDSMAKKATDKHSSAITIFSAKIYYLLDRTFGASNFTIRNFLSASCLSAISFYAFQYILNFQMVYAAHGDWHDYLFINWPTELWLLFFIALLLFPLTKFFNKYNNLWAFSVFMATILHFAHIFTVFPSRNNSAPGEQIINGASNKTSWFSASHEDLFYLFSAEIFYLIAILILMQTTTILRIVVRLGIVKKLKLTEWGLVILYCLGLCLTLCVFLSSFKTDKSNGVYVSFIDIQNYFTLGFVIYGVFCLLQILLILFFVLCVLTLMTNHLFWNLINRPLYNLHRHKVVAMHKWFFRFAIGCFGLFSAKWLPLTKLIGQ